MDTRRISDTEVSHFSILYKLSPTSSIAQMPELQEADGWKGTSETETLRTLLLVQRLRLRSFPLAKGMGSIPCQGTKIPNAVSMANVLKKKKKKYQRIWNLAKRLAEWY